MASPPKCSVPITRRAHSRSNSKRKWIVCASLHTSIWVCTIHHSTVFQLHVVCLLNFLRATSLFYMFIHVLEHCSTCLRTMFFLHVELRGDAKEASLEDKIHAYNNAVGVVALLLNHKSSFRRKALDTVIRWRRHNVGFVNWVYTCHSVSLLLLVSVIPYLLSACTV